MKKEDKGFWFNGIWCNVHRRPRHLCDYRGGITLPCEVNTIDLFELGEVYYVDNGKGLS